LQLSKTRHRLLPVIIATCEFEVRVMVVGCHPWQIVLETPISKRNRVRWIKQYSACLASPKSESNSSTVGKKTDQNPCTSDRDSRLLIMTFLGSAGALQCYQLLFHPIHNCSCSFLSWYWGLNSDFMLCTHSTNTFCVGFFRDRISQAISWGLDLNCEPLDLSLPSS
jgi:hypothetical protein